DRALPAGQGAAEDGPARRGDGRGAARGARLVSTEHTPDVVTFKVELSPTREGARNRIVVYDWFTRGKDRAPPRGDNLVDVLVDGEAGWGRVADDLERAEREIQIATWMCRPNMELL